MDAQPPRGCLNLLELLTRFIELLLGEQTILRLETLWSFLRPSIRGEGRKKKDHDQKRFEDATDHLASSAADEEEVLQDELRFSGAEQRVPRAFRARPHSERRQTNASTYRRPRGAGAVHPWMHVRKNLATAIANLDHLQCAGHGDRVRFAA